MSPYIIMFIILCIGLALAEFFPKHEKLIYSTSFAAVTLFLAFRYGQGTDYNMYKWMYNIAPSELNFDDPYFSRELHGEFSWKVLMIFLKMGGISFEIFIAFLSVVTMGCLHRFIVRYSTNHSLSLLIAYPNLILVYFASGLRQGLVIAIFLGYLIDLIKEKNHLRYCLIVCLLITVHSSAAILVVFPFAANISNIKPIMLACVICFFIGLIPILFPAVNQWLAHLPMIGYYYSEKGSFGISLTNLLRRVMLICFILYTYAKAIGNSKGKHYKKQERCEAFSFLARIYLCGACFYLLFVASSVAASRFFAVAQMLEVALIPQAISILNGRKILLNLCVVLFNVLLLWNVLSSFITERGYYCNSWLTYPYYSVFSPMDEMAKDRPPAFDLP